MAVVDAALHHHVDLDRRKAFGCGRFNCIEHPGHWEVCIVHHPEGCVVERVEAHRDTGKAGGFERARLALQGRPVGCKCEVSARKFAGQHLNQSLDAMAK